MCGRYVLKQKDLHAMLEKLGLGAPHDFDSRYNIAPSTRIPAVRASASARQREVVALQWGLVPHWAKDAKSGAALANARAEGIAGKPAFQNAFRQRRCVVPASGFYEWQTVGRLKQPWYFQLRDEQPFVFAGLWESWHSADGVELQTCSLITTTPNSVISPLHDRMPVILRGDAIDRWLDPAIREPARLEPLLVPVEGEAMKATAVSPRVSNARNEGPECLELAAPLTATPSAPQLSLGLE